MHVACDCMHYVVRVDLTQKLHFRVNKVMVNSLVPGTGVNGLGSGLQESATVTRIDA